MCVCVCVCACACVCVNKIAAGETVSTVSKCISVYVILYICESKCFVLVYSCVCV